MLRPTSLLLLTLVVACKPDTAPLQPTTAPPVVPSAPPVHASVTDPSESGIALESPLATGDPHGTVHAPGPTSVVGTVLETVAAGRYTYLRLKREGGVEEWAAVLSAPVAVGDVVTVLTPFEKRDFNSPTLKRHFDRIWFGTLGGGTQAAAPAATAHETVAPAPGGITITALLGDKATFGGKTVTLRGKVTKYNEGILQRNWLHIVDGSATDGTDDIAVTTTGTTQVGAMVTVVGRVALDKDFGAGYSYAILIEDAEIKAE